MKGEKSGGRQRGTPNKMTRKQREAMQASGLAPLDYLLSVMRDESLGVAERLEAAKAAAPFVHPKLSAVTVKGDLNVRRIERVIVDPKAQDIAIFETKHSGS